MEKEKCFFTEVRDHRRRLEKRITDHMAADTGAHSTSSLSGMIDCWHKLNGMEHELAHCELTPKEAAGWVEAMKNADGTTGAHWNKDQTTAAAKNTGVLIGHISPDSWWAAMNLMYSDFNHVGEKFGVSKPEFYAELAKAFLFDKDGPGPEEKLAAYFHEIADGY